MRPIELDTGLEPNAQSALADTFREGIIPAAAGWALITVDFEIRIDKPQVLRDAVIGGHVTRERTAPVF